MGIYFSHISINLWISASTKIFKKPIYFGMFGLSHTFALLWKFTFPMFCELYGYLLHPKYLRNQKPWDVSSLPYFSRTMEIYFSSILVTTWISVSTKTFKKSITLECLGFLILSPYYGNWLFPYFGNFMDFWFAQNV